ncbi:transcription factor Ouib-like [Eurosta solidaginis]|uniref:transcription factor Ouib-like n=1 Tax=Eurosta solidaginis TaxID=178769 RepID=UPI003530F329
MLQDFKPCRLCAGYKKDMSSISLFEKSCKLVLQRIFQLTGLRLKQLTDIPSVICVDCEKDLNSAYEFRRRCITVQSYFKSSEYKRRTGHHQDQRTKCNLGNAEKVSRKAKQLTNEINTTKTEKEIKVENNGSADTEEFICNRAEFIAIDQNKYTVTEYKKTVSHDKEISEDRLTDNCVIEFDPKKDTAETEINEKVREEADEDTPKIAIDTECPKKANNAKRKCKQKKKDQPTHFICDQCGNNFTNRCHFYTHIKRHTGVKTIQCEVCPDKFFTGGELKRHMRRHTGERPFSCKHCQRRFTDNSTRIKHERTHTNERPFQCLHCDKAFTTGYILKNHMLVHTGERSFICVPCNKSFQRQTILDVHTRSLAHKQNIEREQR